MTTFEVSIRRFDRREGKSNWQITKVAASNQIGAIAKAGREYMRGLSRTEKRDAGKLLEVHAVKLVQDSQS